MRRTIFFDVVDNTRNIIKQKFMNEAIYRDLMTIRMNMYIDVWNRVLGNILNCEAFSPQYLMSIRPGARLP